MSKLIPKYQIFAEAIAEGKTGEEAVERAGYKSRGKAARNQYCFIMAKHGVKEEIERLRKESRSESVWTAEEIKKGLSRMMGKAEQENDFSGFSALTDRLCKMEGYYSPEKLEVSGLDEFFSTVKPKSGLQNDS